MKLMIMSLGGSTEPLIKSIGTNQPKRIIFLASHASVSISGEIFKALAYKPTVEYEITENPNLMFECYKAARRCMDRVRKADITPDELLVDYTGGTKVMTAALILATAGCPCRFNYVGGDYRDKDGLGPVITGHEKMFAEMSPWSIFAEEERRQVVTLFNRRRFYAVTEIIDLCDRELPIQTRDYFRFIRSLAEGFLKWDQFEHKAALRYIDSGLSKLDDYLHSNPDNSLGSFLDEVKKGRAYLVKIITSTNEMEKFHMILISDLLSNAWRKIEDKRYDDAAARIYRALELYGQIVFQEIAGCSNDKVKPEIIPEQLRKDFLRKYSDRDFLKLPLCATFEYLNIKGHEAGIRFFEKQKEIKKIQVNRNASILAHGIKPVSKKAIDSIFDTVSDFVRVKDFFDFPKLP